MSRQIIDIGKYPNDGTGDPIRTAMVKVNDNFQEVYGSWTATGPLILASDNSNTIITDKKITVGRVEVGANLFVNSTALYINGNSYISSTIGVVPTLSVGFGVFANATTVVVGNTVVNTVVSSTGVSSPSHSVIGGPKMDQTGITVGPTFITNNNLTTPSLTAGNSTVNSVGFVNRNTLIDGDQLVTQNVVSKVYLTANVIDAGDITATSLKFRGGGGIQSGNIVANSVTVGNVFIVPQVIAIGNGFSNGTLIGFGGVNTGYVRASGNVYANGIVANTLYVATQQIDSISANLITLGTLATINSTYLVIPSILTNDARILSNFTIDNDLVVGGPNGNTLIDPTGITAANGTFTNQLVTNGRMFTRELYANQQIVVTDVDNNKTFITGTSINTGDMNISKRFTANGIGGNEFILGGGNFANSSSFNFKGLTFFNDGSGDVFRVNRNIEVSNNFIYLNDLMKVGDGVFSIGLDGYGFTIVNGSTVMTTLNISNTAKVYEKLVVGDGGPNTVTVNTTSVNTPAIATKSVIANGNIGTSGQVLTSDGSKVYWSTPAADGLIKTNNLSDVPDKAAARTNLNVPDRTGANASGTWSISITGSANTSTSASQATFANTAENANQLQGKVIGNSPNQIIALDGNGKLPPVDGSQLTNINGANIKGELPTTSDKIIISSTEPDPAQGGQNWIWFKV